MSFEVRFTREAEWRVTEIANWISERSPEGASRWLDALDSAITRLSESADSFGPALEAISWKRIFERYCSKQNEVINTA